MGAVHGARPSHRAGRARTAPDAGGDLPHGGAGGALDPACRARPPGVAACPACDRCAGRRGPRRLGGRAVHGSGAAAGGGGGGGGGDAGRARGPRGDGATLPAGGGLVAGGAPAVPCSPRPVSVLYPVSGLVLYLGGRFDRRSRLLGAVLVLLGAFWAQSVAGGLGVGLYPELFLPAVVWLFVGEFPRVRRWTRLDLLARRMALLAAVVGEVLQLANLAPVQALSPSLGVLAREVSGAYIAPAFFGPLLRAHPRGARRPSVARRGRGARRSFADAGVRGRGRGGAGAARRRGGRGVLPGDGHGGGGELGRPPRGRPASRPGRSAGRRSAGCGGRGRWRGRTRPRRSRWTTPTRGLSSRGGTAVRSASARTSACRTRTNCRMWGSRFVTVVIRDELQPSASTGSRRPQVIEEPSGPSSRAFRSGTDLVVGGRGPSSTGSTGRPRRPWSTRPATGPATSIAPLFEGRAAPS